MTFLQTCKDNKLQVFITHIVTNEIKEINDALVEEVTFLEKITDYPHETIIVYYSPDNDNSIDEVYDRIPNNVKIIKAKFIPTQKNKPVENFLPSCGFNKDGNEWIYSLESDFIVPNHLTIQVE